MLEGRASLLAYSEPEDAAELARGLRDSELVGWARVTNVTHIVGEPLVSLVRDVLRDKITDKLKEDAECLFYMTAQQASGIPEPR